MEPNHPSTMKPLSDGVTPAAIFSTSTEASNSPGFTGVQNPSDPGNSGVDAADKNEKIEFSDAPVECICSTCNKIVTTHVVIETSWRTILIACLALIFLGWLGCVVIPFLWPLLQDSVHSCSRCNTTIARRRRWRLPHIRKDIVTCRCGSCAIVLSRKYVFIMVLMFTTIFAVYLIRVTTNMTAIDSITKGPPIDAAWSEFVDDCTRRSQLGNPTESKKIFEQKYYLKTVTWRGIVEKATEGFFKKNFLHLDMDAAGSPGSKLALKFDDDLEDDVTQLHKGDIVAFEATLLKLGSRGQPHFGELWSLKVVEKYDSQPPPSSFLPFPLGPFSLMNALSSMVGDRPTVGSRMIIMSRGTPVITRMRLISRGVHPTDMDTSSGSISGPATHVNVLKKLVDGGDSEFGDAHGHVNNSANDFEEILHKIMDHEFPKSDNLSIGGGTHFEGSGHLADVHDEWADENHDDMNFDIPFRMPNHVVGHHDYDDSHNAEYDSAHFGNSEDPTQRVAYDAADQMGAGSPAPSGGSEPATAGEKNDIGGGGSSLAKVTPETPKNSGKSSTTAQSKETGNDGSTAAAA